MKRERDAQGIDLTGRIQSLEQFTGTLVARPPAEVVQDAIPINEAPATRVPSPRRSRIFLRSGGAFADLTVTAPVPRGPADRRV